MKDTASPDCILIPGAEKADDAAMVEDCMGGGMAGLVTVDNMNGAAMSKTICCKLKLLVSPQFSKIGFL